MHRHLQEREALVEVDGELEVDARLAPAEADGPGTRELRSRPSMRAPTAQRAGLLDLPVAAAEPRLDRLVPAVGVEGPGVGGVVAQVQADAAATENVAPRTRSRNAAAAERDGPESRSKDSASRR